MTDTTLDALLEAVRLRSEWHVKIVRGSETLVTHKYDSYGKAYEAFCKFVQMTDFNNSKCVLCYVHTEILLEHS